MMTQDVSSGVLNYGCFLVRDKPNLGLGSDSSFITSQTVQLPLPYSEKPQNLDNTPFAQKKTPYHDSYMRWKYYGDSSEISRKILWINNNL